MTYYFGFEPSDELKTKISAMRSAVAANEKELYKHRDAVVHKTVEELIDYLLTKIVNTFPDGDHKKTMIKVTDIVQSTSTKLLNQVLGKDKNEDVMPTVDFFENQTAHKDANGVERLGFKMSDTLYNSMNDIFTQTISSGDGDGKALNSVFDSFTDAVVQHFLSEFSSTLNLGFVKRKLLPIADSAIKKGVKMGNKQIFPHLAASDKVEVCELYQPLIYQV